MFRLSSSLPSNASTQSITVAAAAATATAVAVAALWKKRGLKRVELAKRKEGYEKFRLLPFESSYVCKSLEGISTITFFEAESMEDVEAARSFFQARALAVAEANPWLLGFIDVDESDREGNLALFVPQKESKSEQSSFSIFEPPEPIPEEYHSMVEALRPAMIGDTFTHMASISLGNTTSWEPLWKVTFIPDVDCDHNSKANGNDQGSKPHRFGLVVSGNHCLLDGHGYYKIFNMFSSREPIAALSPIRNHDLQSSIEALFPEPPMHLDPPPGFILSMVASRTRNAFVPTPTKSIGFVVSGEWIREQKEAYRESIANGAGTSAPSSPSLQLPPFVSTNDVLVSEFSKATACDLSNMAINLRGRVDGCTDELLGNHEGGLTYTKNDYRSPASIRQSIAGPLLQRIGAASGQDPLPTSWEHLTGCSYTFTSSWATFAKAITVGKTATTEEIKQSLHVPLLDFPKTFPACFCSFMITFRPREGEIAILSSGTAELMEKLATNKMVGSLIYSQ